MQVHFDNLFSTNPEQNENVNQDHSDIKTQDGIFDGLGITSQDSYGDDELFTGLNVGANSKEKIDSSVSNNGNANSGLSFLYHDMSFDNNNNNTKAQTSTTNFDTLFQQMQNNTAPPVVNPTLRNIGGFNLSDPFANVSTQPTQPQPPTSKNKKEDKDPFAEFNLGTLGI